MSVNTAPSPPGPGERTEQLLDRGRGRRAAEARHEVARPVVQRQPPLVGQVEHGRGRDGLVTEPMRNTVSPVLAAPDARSASPARSTATAPLNPRSAQAASAGSQPTAAASGGGTGERGGGGGDETV